MLTRRLRALGSCHRRLAMIAALVFALLMAEHAIAQTAPPGSTSLHAEPKHAGGPAGRQHIGEPQGKLAEQQRDDRRLRAAYQTWQKRIAVQIRTAAQERAQWLEHEQQAAHGAPNGGAAGSARHPGPPPIPAATRAAAVAAATSPMRDPPRIAILGGPTADRKSTGALTGGAVRHQR